jgi:hypothetical protein
MDGLKIILQDDSWVLMRPSGTEPLIRTYAEGATSQTMNDLIQESDRLVHLPPPNPKRKKDDGKKKKKDMKPRAGKR